MKISIKTLLITLAILFIVLNFTGCFSEPKLPKTKWQPEFNLSYPVLITSVIDGDTIKVQISNGSILTVRLIGIDTPEMSNDHNNIYEYENILNLSCLTFFGISAKNYTQMLLLNQNGYISFDELLHVVDDFFDFKINLNLEELRQLNEYFFSQ